jgi:hypothetical protein
LRRAGWGLAAHHATPDFDPTSVEAPEELRGGMANLGAIDGRT